MELYFKHLTEEAQNQLYYAVDFYAEETNQSEVKA